MFGVQKATAPVDTLKKGLPTLRGIGQILGVLGIVVTVVVGVLVGSSQVYAVYQDVETDQGVGVGNADFRGLLSQCWFRKVLRERDRYRQ